MTHARYSDECGGHFGLASEYYTHFTSPIRRYPDLIVHRMIKEWMHNNGVMEEKRKEHLKERMNEYALQASMREKVAEEAERESVDLKMVEYMVPYVGERFTAMISGVTAFGFFVRLENGVEGLVHISTLVDDFYQFLAGSFTLIGENTGNKFQLGQMVQVKLVQVNIEERQLDFELEFSKKVRGRKGSQTEKITTKNQAVTHKKTIQVHSNKKHTTQRERSKKAKNHL